MIGNIPKAPASEVAIQAVSFFQTAKIQIAPTVAIHVRPQRSCYHSHFPQARRQRVGDKPAKRFAARTAGAGARIDAIA